MGYYVSIKKSSVVIPHSKVGEVFKRFKALNGSEFNHQKKGGSWSGGEKTKAWYSWMPADYDQTATSAKEVLEMLGFWVAPSLKGDLAIKSHEGKQGQEAVFFEAIADLIPEGQQIVWEGEDGVCWRWKFDGNQMTSRGLLEESKDSWKSKLAAWFKKVRTTGLCAG